MGKADPKDYYREEAFELLDTIESTLLELEDAPKDIDLINTVFRALHTIKGSGSMFGFDRIAAFAHEVEALFDLLREQEIDINKEIIDLTLSSRDHIKMLFEYVGEDIPGEDRERQEAILERIRAYTSRAGEETRPERQEGEAAESEEEDTVERTYRITFVPQKDIFLKGINPELLFGEIAELGQSFVMAHMDDIPPVEDLDPENCYTGWTILVTTTASINRIRDVFIFVEDYSDIKIDVIDEGNIEEEEDYKRIGEILYERGTITRKDIKNILEKRPLFGSVAVEEGILSEEDIDSALEEQRYIRDLRQKRKETAAATTIRVNNEKLDQLVDLVGELVTLQARLSQYTEDKQGSEIESIGESLERLTAELRDNTMSLRMVPLAETFRGFNRLVRDLSNELGKEVELITAGAETELDKNIIEQLKDPLVHIIRNSIDHGFETPEARRKAGKPPAGTLALSAEYAGANVLIRIKDDGRGLDPAAIRRKALERDIIKEADELSGEEIFKLIFAPGFSTAEQATSVSGRGVGMDVVKRNIERLRGSVDIESAEGQGTTVLLKIPLTLSIIDGLLIRVADEKFIINLSVVDECFDLTEDILYQSEGGSIAQIRGNLVPYVRLRHLFGYGGETSGVEQMAVVDVDGNRIGIVADEILGQYQTVIKPLSTAFRSIQEVSGSTILGDGTISLILDVTKIAQMTRVEKAIKNSKGASYAPNAYG